MYIPNDDTQNYPFFKLHFVVETFARNKQINQNSIKGPQVVKLPNKQTLLKDFGTSVIKRSMFLLSLDFNCNKN